MITATLFTMAGALVLDESSRRLGALVQQAIERAGLKQGYVATCLRVPPQKLSDQLTGKLPFTAFWRFYAVEEIREAVWPELLELFGERHGCVVVAAEELRALVLEVRQLVQPGGKRMAKSDLASGRVQLPLRKERA